MSKIAWLMPSANIARGAAQFLQKNGKKKGWEGIRAASIVIDPRKLPGGLSLEDATDRPGDAGDLFVLRRLQPNATGCPLRLLSTTAAQEQTMTTEQGSGML
jgi:hypothetical protein